MSRPATARQAMIRGEFIMGSTVAEGPRIHPNVAGDQESSPSFRRGGVDVSCWAMLGDVAWENGPGALTLVRGVP